MTMFMGQGLKMMRAGAWVRTVQVRAAIKVVGGVAFVSCLWATSWATPWATPWATKNVCAQAARVSNGPEVAPATPVRLPPDSVRLRALKGIGVAPKTARSGKTAESTSVDAATGAPVVPEGVSPRHFTVSKALGLPVPNGAVTITKQPTFKIASKLRVPIGVQGVTGASVGAKEVRVISGEGALRVDPQGAMELEPMAVGTTVLSVSNASEIAAGNLLSTRKKTAMPWLVVDHHSAEGAGGVRDDLRVARPFLQLAQAVRWDPEAKQHVAEFWVGLQSENGHTGALTEPLTAVLSVSCDEVTPAKVTLASIGPAGDQRIRVVCSRHVKNERVAQSLGVRLADGRLDYPFELPRRPGPYELATSATHVSGFGIGEFTLTVTQTEVDGTPLPVSAQDALSLPLVVEGGEVDAPTIEFERGKSHASTVLHAAGVGALTMRVGTAERQSQVLSIERTWPWSFMFSTLLGGGIGGYLAGLGKRKRKAVRLRRMGEGALVGVLLVGLFVLIPSTVPLFPDWARSNELAWLVIAGIAGFMGIELVERTAALVFPKRVTRPTS